MKLIVEPTHLRIVSTSFSYPDDSNRNLDIAYIERVLGLKKEGDSVKLVRVNAMGTSSIAYLETEEK